MTVREDGVWSETLDLTEVKIDNARRSTGTAGRSTGTVRGHLAPGAPDWVYLPVTVPHRAVDADRVTWIAARYDYSRPEVADGAIGNAADLGVFDPRGCELGGTGFRGWSGGARAEFVITEASATPGYLPGPIPAGTWYVVLAPYTVAADGMDFTVQVEIGSGTPPADLAGTALPRRTDHPAQLITGRGAGWYRGDSHLHTVYSDGKRTPADVAALARGRSLDFMISTDHNTPASHGTWGEHAGDDLLIITGEEVTTRNGHLLALGIEPDSWIDWRFRAVDDQLPRFVDSIHDHGGIAVAAHPYGGCIGCFWRFGFDHVDAVEVWNGPWNIGNEAAVATWDNLLVAGGSSGRWLPAIGNSDAHADPDVVGLPQTVVRAEQLGRRQILAGIAAGHSWIAESADLELDLVATAGDHSAGIGERLTVNRQTSVTVSVRVAGLAAGTIRLITDQGPMHVQPLATDGVTEVSWQTTGSLTGYVRVEVRHPVDDPAFPFGRMAALTNPIRLR
ncbi:CehA/McbA family metallohydrolase [Microlunatus soli]|uniref:Polymerase/histidinol phosphatase N-terminal domain-containing protein n=1 Tax=Microlunatus soli TaxID=630515 RepID=A0A1H1Z3P0_9ACTN|nr:CehA/McbA family metallohydrolase [Microlunatus soli]SDT28364.1 hypothetical protein SAMN04489812_4965 [Microlunatus soli]